MLALQLLCICTSIVSLTYADHLAFMRMLDDAMKVHPKRGFQWFDGKHAERCCWPFGAVYVWCFGEKP